VNPQLPQQGSESYCFLAAIVIVSISMFSNRCEI
jgi:hypothetical protein